MHIDMFRTRTRLGAILARGPQHQVTSGHSVSFKFTPTPYIKTKWILNVGAVQIIANDEFYFDLVANVGNAALRCVISDHGGTKIQMSTIFPDEEVNQGCSYEFYEDGQLKQTGGTEFTPTSSTSVVTVYINHVKFAGYDFAGGDVNCGEPYAQGMGGNPKRIQLTKGADLINSAGSKIAYRINGGSVTETTANSVQVTMPNGTATLEFWGKASNVADSQHQTTSWNELMV